MLISFVVYLCVYFLSNLAYFPLFPFSSCYCCIEWELTTRLKEFVLVCVISLTSFWQGYHNSVCQLLLSHDKPHSNTGNTLLFSNNMRILLYPAQWWRLKSCETEPTVHCPYLRRLESRTICRCNYKRQHFLLSYLETTSVGLARVWTPDLLHGSPILH